MKHWYRNSLIILLAILFTIPAFATRYGRRLCSSPDYHCIRVKRGDTWKSLFPNARHREIVRRVNRTNMRLRRGSTIAVPNNLTKVTHMQLAPFPYRIEPLGRRLILINLRVHAFAAYDRYGFLVHWGPMSGGRGWCPDVGRRCRTPRGHFKMIRKQGAGCVSKKFPVGVGGAPMPYCMFFYKGFAMHGSYLPGYHASHGCVRLFTEDARWLNREFIRTGRQGTKVIIKGSLQLKNFYFAPTTLMYLRQEILVA